MAEGSTITPLLVDDAGAAALGGFSRRKWQQLEVQGRIGPRPVRFGKCKRWVVSQLEAWAAAGCPGRRDWEAEAGGAV